MMILEWTVNNTAQLPRYIGKGYWETWSLSPQLTTTAPTGFIIRGIQWGIVRGIQWLPVRRS